MFNLFLFFFFFVDVDPAVDWGTYPPFLSAENPFSESIAFRHLKELFAYTAEQIQMPASLTRRKMQKYKYIPFIYFSVHHYQKSIVF